MGAYGDSGSCSAECCSAGYCAESTVGEGSVVSPDDV